MGLCPRDLALDVLRRVFTQGAFASAVLRGALENLSHPADRGLATELVYGVLRHRGHLDRAIGRAAGKRLKDLDPKLHDVMRIGAYQIMFLERVPDHAAVDCAVTQAKKRRGKRGGGQTNAILRKLADTDPEQRLPAPPTLAKEPVRHVAEVGSLPHALSELLVQDLGAEEALAFSQASLQIAPLTVRANQLKTTREALVEEVRGDSGSSPYSVLLPKGLFPADLDSVTEGRATPQDEASMRVVELLDPQPSERILDLCAAPGGKTTYIAECQRDQGKVIAHDRLPSRLALVERAAERLGLSSIETIETLPLDGGFDRVLVDAPCSGLGTLRRHPEIRWRFRPDDLDGICRTQQEVLSEGKRQLRSGGTLVYAVCSVSNREGEAHFDDLEDDFELTETIRTGPHQEGAPDGFFMAKLVRK